MNSFALLLRGCIGTYSANLRVRNNLLEMTSFALHVIINKYDVYKSDIEPLGLRFPAIDIVS
jgi:hypothetical protein